MRELLTLTLLCISIITQAQSIVPLMFAQVQYSINHKNNTCFLSPKKIAEGYFESVELLEIDSTLILRCVDGKSNEHGFIENGSEHSIMFKISELTYEWSDPIKQDGILFKGTCYSNLLDCVLPFSLYLNSTGNDILTVGYNEKTLKEVKNFDLNRLFEIGREVNKKNSSTPSTSYKKIITKKHKPELTK